MARKAIPAHPTRDRTRDESLLLRSAESLGRMIGSLQRQRDIATGRLNASKPNGGNGRKKVATARSSATARSGTTSTSAGARKKSPVRKIAKKR